MKLHDSREVSAPKNAPPGFFSPKKHPIWSWDSQERPDPTGGYGKKVTAAPRRVFTAAASGIWI